MSLIFFIRCVSKQKKSLSKKGVRFFSSGNKLGRSVYRKPFSKYLTNKIISRNYSNLVSKKHYQKQFSLFSVQKLKFSTSPYPFRPGYGLGSWIPPGVVDGMEAEGRCRGKITVLEQILTDLESTTRELVLEKNSLQNNQSGNQTIPIPEGLDAYIDKLSTARSTIYGKKITALQELFDMQEALANADDPTLSIQAFNAGAMSPVKWSLSDIAFKERASDSLVVNARFFNFDKNTQSASSFANEVSSQAGLDVSGFGRGVSASVQSTVNRQASSTAESRTIESTLLLTAKATHSKVMQFGTLIVDDMLLMNAWNFYHGGLGLGSSSGGNEELRLDISKLTPQDCFANPNQLEKISLVTEQFMGSAFVGMVHFLKKESTRSSTSSSSEKFEAAAKVKMGAFLASISGDSSMASSAARQAMNASSTGEFDVKFDLFCLGYSPPIQDNELSNTVKAFANFDPANFKIEPEDDSPEAKTEAKNARASNMKCIIDATMSNISEGRNLKVLDFNTFMSAFNNYCENAPEKEGVGVPIGLNIRTWTRDQIATILYNKYVAGDLVPGMADIGEEGVNNMNPSTSE